MSISPTNHSDLDLNDIPDDLILPATVDCIICDAVLQNEELKIVEHISQFHFGKYKGWKCVCGHIFNTKQMCDCISTQEFKCCPDFEKSLVTKTDDFNEKNEQAQQLILRNIQSQIEGNEIDSLNLVEHMTNVINNYRHSMPQPPFTAPEPNFDEEEEENDMQSNKQESAAANIQQVTSPMISTAAAENAVAACNLAESSKQQRSRHNSKSSSTSKRSIELIVLDDDENVKQETDVDNTQYVTPPITAHNSSASILPHSTSQTSQSAELPIWLNCRLCCAVILIEPNLTNCELRFVAQSHIFECHNFENSSFKDDKTKVPRNKIVEALPEVFSSKKRSIATQNCAMPQFAVLPFTTAVDYSCVNCGEIGLANGLNSEKGDCDLLEHAKECAHALGQQLTSQFFWSCFPETGPRNSNGQII